ncbi:hypothetical protein BC834DRAFT_573597 [Gloeopeniophorella convolvens]|nr:hypothetical protein BC834DRAFT_573597 [Gloeopeniophorella convolvens]
MFRKPQPSPGVLARCAYSAHSLLISQLDDAALASLRPLASDRINAYARWDGTTDLDKPLLDPVDAILAARALPDPGFAILPAAFVDLSLFTPDAAAFHPAEGDPGLNLPQDAGLAALLRARNSDLVDSLLRLARDFGKRGTMGIRGGRARCGFEGFVPEVDAGADPKGRAAFPIIAAVWENLEKARSQPPPPHHSPAPMAGEEHPPEHRDGLRCSECLAELHRGMMRLYREWWEDMGRVLLGEPEAGVTSVWDGVRDNLTAPLRVFVLRQVGHLLPRWLPRWCRYFIDSVLERLIPW